MASLNRNVNAINAPHIYILSDKAYNEKEAVLKHTHTHNNN